MIKKISISIVSIIILGCMVWFFIPQDNINKLKRKMIELKDGNYLVTYAQDSITKEYKVKNGKITSSDKGYYFFWTDTVNGSKYVQTPIDKTLIEEL